MPIQAELNSPRKASEVQVARHQVKEHRAVVDQHAQVDDGRQGQQEAVTPGALVEIGQSQVIEDTQGFHAGTSLALRHHCEVHILQVGRHRLGIRAGLCFGDRPHLNSIHAPDRAADQELLFERRQLLAGGHPFPHRAFHLPEQLLRVGADFQMPLVDDGDIRGGRFHVRDDVRGEDDNPLAGQIREQIAEAHPLLGVQPHGRLVHDQQLRIVEQRLGDAHALAHSAGITAQRPAGGVAQVDQVQQVGNFPTGLFAAHALDGRHVFEELLGRKVGVDAEVLRQVAQHRAQRLRIFDHIPAVPQNGPLGGLGDGCQHAHQG